MSVCHLVKWHKKIPILKNYARLKRWDKNLMIIEQPVPINYPEPSILRQPYSALIATNANRNLPIITLQVSPDSVPEDADHKLLFKFTRSGDLKNPLIVYYNVTGTAEYKKDYKASFSESEIQQLFIPSGASSVIVEVIPIEDRKLETDETVILSIVPDDSYNLGTVDDVYGVIRGNKAAFAWLNYAPIAAFATPLVLSPWDNNIYSRDKTGDSEKKEPPNVPKPECISNCYYVPEPFSILAIFEGYKKTRRFRKLSKRVKSHD